MNPLIFLSGDIYMLKALSKWISVLTISLCLLQDLFVQSLQSVGLYSESIQELLEVT